ncbi:hypothetical protein PN450_17360 [Dolichospermum lemmermannii CS-548]|uniref:hypothetical protein n=1 Tax=Dolichospermum lemmermannii TaxID=54295 RepID=UPI00232C96A4|nr:hypothetical protein [Dolichospermum lemmermannii]MDB9438525.1 hypothetical protein [Dolichospermum lemmermannii CS-548]
MFRLHRWDVLPVDDLGIRNAIRNVYNLPEFPSQYLYSFRFIEATLSVANVNNTKLISIMDILCFYRIKTQLRFQLFLLSDVNHIYI